MDISYNELSNKLNAIESKYPKLVKLWNSYIEKHTNLYKKCFT